MPTRINKLQAIFGYRCPRCRQGDLFEKGKIFPKPLENCPVCGLRYEREPDFFQGAMYVSYAISVAIFITFGFGAYFVFNDPPTYVYWVTVISAAILLSPLNWRLSKSLFIHWFGGVKYQPEIVKENT